MTFPSRDLAGSLSGCFLPVAGNCGERAGGPLRALVAFFIRTGQAPGADVVRPSARIIRAARDCNRRLSTKAPCLHGVGAGLASLIANTRPMIFHAAARISHHERSAFTKGRPSVHSSPPSMNELHHGRLLCGGQRMTGAGQ